MEIEWHEKAVQELDKLDNFVGRRIIKKIDSLKTNISSDVKRLKGSDDFRLRIGDYRILFQINGDLIKILKIGHRKNIYKK